MYHDGGIQPSTGVQFVLGYGRQNWRVFELEVRAWDSALGYQASAYGIVIGWETY